MELECSAGRAQARGGLAAAAAFLERSVLLTADPARHAERALAAAQASLQAGAFGKALDLLATAEAGPLDELQSARVDLLRGQPAGSAADCEHSAYTPSQAAAPPSPIWPPNCPPPSSPISSAWPRAPQSDGCAKPEATGPATRPN